MLAGIDVGKWYLDVCIGGERTQRFQNTRQAIGGLITTLNEHNVTRVICEPTGGYERELVQTLRTASIQVQVAHPNKVRAFAQASGVLAKTDRIDARVLYEYGVVFTGPSRREPSDKVLELRDILRRRQQLITTRTREMNRLEKQPTETIRVSCQRHLEWLSEEIAELDRAVDAQLADIELKPQIDRYCSVKGVGRLTAATLIAELPELGEYDSKSLTALVGLAPWSRDSGKQHGYRAIRGGRMSVRKALYMAALSTIRWKGPLREFYLRLRERGKPGKVALVAVMRKLLLYLNAVAHRKTPWIENPGIT